METKELVIVEERVLYRYVDGLRQFKDNPYLEKYKIIRETEKSYFIETFYADRKRVPKIGKNIYAWDSVQKALYNYYRRKRKQVEILKYRLETARSNYAWAKSELMTQGQWEQSNPTTEILNKIKEDR